MYLLCLFAMLFFESLVLAFLEARDPAEIFLFGLDDGPLAGHELLLGDFLFVHTSGL